jgi:hypothetical protein
VIVEYEVNKQTRIVNGQYRGYIGNDFAIFTGEQLIGLYPGETQKWDEDLSIIFDVPKESKIITPWVSVKDVYYPNRDFYSENKGFTHREYVQYYGLL